MKASHIIIVVAFLDPACPLLTLPLARVLHLIYVHLEVLLLVLGHASLPLALAQQGAVCGSLPWPFLVEVLQVALLGLLVIVDLFLELLDQHLHYAAVLVHL